MRAKILKNKKYYLVLPKMPQTAVKAFVYVSRLAYGKKLKHAKVSTAEVTRHDLDMAGVLLRRGL